jgi:hypothetical protein
MTLLVIMLLLHIPRFVAWAFPVLISYAGFFFAMPAARALWVLGWCVSPHTLTSSHPHLTLT